jgi:hypothetical protein
MTSTKYDFRIIEKNYFTVAVWTCHYSKSNPSDVVVFSFSIIS